MGGDEWMRNMHPHGNASGALVPYENIMGSYYTYRKERLGSEGARISMPRIRIAFKDW